MDANYKNFINYLNANQIRYDNNEDVKLIRFGYNIDMGTIEIVVDFEHEKRIGFFSFLNMTTTEERKPFALELLNYFNESLNYGSIIISQNNQIIYKIMYSTFDNTVTDEQWSEIIFRLWSISRDIFPLFGRLIFTKEDPKLLFEEFLRSKEKLARSVNNEVEDPENNQKNEKQRPGPDMSGNQQNKGFGGDFRDWYLQN